MTEFRQVPEARIKRLTVRQAVPEAWWDVPAAEMHEHDMVIRIIAHELAVKLAEFHKVRIRREKEYRILSVELDIIVPETPE